MSFKKNSHPCVIIDVLTDVWVEEVMVEVCIINVWSDVVIDTLPGVSVDVIIDVLASDIGVEVLIDVNVNVLLADMTAL